MRGKINLLLKFGLVFIALVSILPSIFPNIWIIDILSNFKLQLVLVLIIIFLLNLFIEKSKTLGVISIILIAWNTSFFYSLYFPSKSTSINKQKRISIVSLNLLSSNNESEKVIEFIKNKNPDILVLLEYNPKWEKGLQSITNEYQFSKTEVKTGNFGIGYFSKIESKLSIHRFDHTQVPSIIASLKYNNDSLIIIATHPFAPIGQSRFETRNLHLKNLAEKSKNISENLIVVGDLNTSSYSKHFADFLDKTRLKDSRSGRGILSTWPSNLKFMRTALDHFLVSEKINISKREVGKNVGSDHLPIFMEFAIKD